MMRRWLWVPLVVGACQVPPGVLSPAPFLAGARTAGTLYPLGADARWTYALAQRQNDGPVTKKELAIRVKSREARPDGTVVAVLERRYGSFTPPATRVLRTRERVTLSRLADPEDGPSLTVLRFPLTREESWPGREFDNGVSEVVSARGHEPVEVPAGRYDAWRVDHVLSYPDGGGDTLSYWYAPGAGTVKLVERTTLKQGESTLRVEVTGLLTSYSPGVDD